MWHLVAIVAVAAVLVIAFCGVGRAWTYLRVGFAAFMMGALLIIASPPPPGYTSTEDRRADEPQYELVAEYAPRAGIVLCAIGVACLLAAAGFNHFKKPPVEEGD